MKLRAFWPESAEVWFAQPDTQFAIKNVTVLKTKFYQAKAVLPQQVAAQLLDLIRSPPAVNPYKMLEERLITLYSLNSYYLPSDVRSHLLQEKVSDPRALTLKADKLFQCKTLSPVNFLYNLQDDYVQVNAVSTRTFPTCPSQAPPAPSTCFPSSPGPCCHHKKHGEKAVNCQKPCLESEN